MSDTIKGSKGPGYEYWSPRKPNGGDIGAKAKKIVHRRERRIAKNKIRVSVKGFIVSTCTLLCPILGPFIIVGIAIYSVYYFIIKGCYEFFKIVVPDIVKKYKISKIKKLERELEEARKVAYN